MLSFYYCQLIVRQQQKYLQRLKRYLNLTVIPSPNLPVTDDFDIATHSAILKFKKQFNRKFGKKVVVEDGTLTNTLWMDIWSELGKIDRKFRDQELINLEPELKSIINGVPYVANMALLKKCDDKLAEIFGEKNAVVATIYDPKELKRTNGTPHPNAGAQRSIGHSAIPKNETIGETDRGGIIHLYPNPQGLPEDVGVFAPAGFTEIFQINDGIKVIRLLPKADNQKYFFNQSKQNPLYIVYSHVKTAGVSVIGIKRADGAVKIGNIGGPGGSGSPVHGGYVHCHIVFYSKYFGNPTTGVRVDPRDYFCK